MDERTKRELARLNEIFESEQIHINQTMSVEWQIAKEQERIRTDKVIALQRENEWLRELQSRYEQAMDAVSHLRDMNSRANDGIEELHKKITRITNVANHHEWVANKYKAQYEKVVAELTELKRVTCKLCGGTGKKAVGEHETLTNEWVTDYDSCDHREEV
jgi:putative protein kinase ArgK-like GTPase of G3E family